MPSLRTTIGALFIAFVGLGATFAVGALVGPNPSPLELTISEWAMATWPPALMAFFNVALSLPIVLPFALCAALLSYLGHRSGWAMVFVSALFVEVPVAAIKALIDRPRPPAAFIEALGSTAGYPSGHTVRAVVLVGLMGALLIRTRRTSPLLAALGVATIVTLVAMARLASGEHWLVDVVGGALLGYAWLLASLRLLIASLGSGGTHHA